MKSEKEIIANLVWEILKQYEMDVYATHLFINNNSHSIKSSCPNSWDSTKENDNVVFQQYINGSWLVVELVG